MRGRRPRVPRPYAIRAPAAPGRRFGMAWNVRCRIDNQLMSRVINVCMAVLETSMSLKLILVAACALVDADGRVLLAKRPKGRPLEGLWEFPGGKCEPGEALAPCMARELREELGVTATVGREIFSIAHEYPDRIVRLHFFECQCDDEPVPQLGQEMRWVERDALETLEFPPADAELIRLLQAAE